jgi:DNA-binding PadR family transcriptional regulator
MKLTAAESARDLIPLAAIDFHLLVVLAEGESYGYAIKKELAATSGGAIDPEIGSLYRVIARLTKNGTVQEAGKRAAADSAHPGNPRRYYAITELGREVMALEAARMRALLDAADGKDLITEVKA